MKELLTKTYAGLPGWAWLLIGAAGIGAGIILIRFQQKGGATPAALTTQSTPDLTTGNASGAESNPQQGAIGSNGIVNNPFPEATVNGQQVPVIPPGYQAIFDENGNIIGFEPITLPINPPPSGGGGSSNPPGSTFKGPTGVLHYVATGSANLTQLAQRFHLKSWNSIYAIPDNQKLFGQLDAQKAANYTPAAGLVITLPGDAMIVQNTLQPMTRSLR